MKILVLVNTLQSVNSFVYSNHIDFFVTSVKKDPKIQFIFFTPHRMPIDVARNTAAKLAMENECDYLMFIDDDVMIPPETLHKLLMANKDIIAGLVIIRGAPFNVMAFKWQEDKPGSLTFYNDLPLSQDCSEGHSNHNINCGFCRRIEPKELVQVEAVGFSCCLIKTEVLHALEPPYFVTAVNHTEDIYFCLKSKTLEPNPQIFLHTGVKCGHLLNSEPIEWETRHKFQEFYHVDPVKPFARNQEHIDKCLAKML